MDNDKLIAVIPARKNSNRVRHKNLKYFFGDMLAIHKLKQATSVRQFDKIILTTDSNELIIEAKKLKDSRIMIVKRPDNLATAESNTIEAVKHVVNLLGLSSKTSNSAIVLLQPTSPLFSSVDITCAIDQYLNDKDIDKKGLFAVERLPGKFRADKHYIYNCSNDEIVRANYCEPNDLGNENKIIVSRNGCSIYILKIKYLEYGFFQKGIKGYLTHSSLSIDIDTELDWLLSSLLYKYILEHSIEDLVGHKDY